jgi:hypothetical protein
MFCIQWGGHTPDRLNNEEESKMEQRKVQLGFTKLDWRWIGVGYCFYVVFHLLPSYLLLGFGRLGDVPALAKIIWLFFGLALIGFYIGYSSRGVTIWEPAIAAVLYDLTLMLEFSDFWGRSVQNSLGIFFIWIIATLVITIASAWEGEMVQVWKESKAKASMPS